MLKVTLRDPDGPLLLNYGETLCFDISGLIQDIYIGLHSKFFNYHRLLSSGRQPTPCHCFRSLCLLFLDCSSRNGK